MGANTLGMSNRSAERVRTRIYGTVTHLNQSATGKVVDLSATGIALELAGPFSAAQGSKVKIESEELGFIEGTVKWCRGGRVGIQLDLNSNALAQLSSYFRFFHQDVKPVLTR